MSLSLPLIRQLCDRSFYHFVKIVGGSVGQGGVISPVIHKPLCDFYQDRSIHRKAIFMPRAWLKCVHPDTLVQMADGSEKKIRDIRVGDRVVGYDGFSQVFSEVSGKWESEAELYDIRFRSGRSVIASDKHRFLQVDGSYQALPKYSASIRGLKTEPTSEISLDDAALIAYLVAEGCMVSGNMSFTNGIKEVQDDFEAIVSRKGWAFRKATHTGCVEYRLNGGDIKGKHRGTPRDWARSFGIYDKSSREKTLPDAIMTANKDTLTRVIEVLFATDGTLGVYGGIAQVGYCSVSKSLCLQIQNILNRFGVFSSVVFVANDYGGAYHLRVSGGDNWAKFVSLFNIPGKGKAQEAVRAAGVRNGHNTPSDLLPSDVRDLVTEIGLRRDGVRIDNHYGISRSKASRIPSIAGIASAEVNWDDVVSCERVGLGPAIDIETTSGNYVANGLITHNSTVFTCWGTVWDYLQDYNCRTLIASQNDDNAKRFLWFIQHQFKTNHLLRKLYPDLEQIDNVWVKRNRWSAKCVELPRGIPFKEGRLHLSA